MTDWRWKGARWWKFDFHTHTPASDDYGKGMNQPDLRNLSPKEWLLNYMRAGIDCIAITDHNTGDWVNRLKEALQELEAEDHPDFHKLYLFPGMEISVTSGIHLLAIFDPLKTSSNLDVLLGKVDYRGTPGRSDNETSMTFDKVVEIIVSTNGIAIPAHVDRENGLFLQYQGNTLQKALDCKDVFAMELMDLNFQKPQTYIDKRLNWTEVLGSDAHHPNGNEEQRYPGSHFTWVKMESPGIEGLRLALLDGQLSVQRSDQVNIDPNGYADSVIEKIEVSNSRYIGRANTFKQTFNPWLNGIIGGRGTGKSTLVEFLRIALRRVDELPEDLEPEFEKYCRVYPDRKDDGLLTKDAEIKVIYRKNGIRFRIQWDINGGLESIEQEGSNGEWRRAIGDIRQRFPIRVYSQKQIFQLAKKPLALLRVVDETSDVDLHAWSEKWKIEESRFLSQRAKVREIEIGFVEERRLRGELEDVKRKLAIFEKAGHSEILKSFQKWSRQQQDIEAWEKSWTGVEKQLSEISDEIVPDLLEGTSFDLNSTEDNELKGYAARVHNRMEEIRKGVEALASQAGEVVVEWRKNKNESSWKKCVEEAVQAYQELKENLALESAGDPAAYGEFVQRRQTIEQQLNELQERKKQVVELKKQADAQLQRLMEIRRELTENRRKFLSSVLRDNPYVQIRVVPYGAREIVESEFRRLLRKEDGSFDKDIGSPDGQGLLGELYVNFCNAEDFEHNLSNFKTRVKKIASDEYGKEKVADLRFAAHVRKLQPEDIDRLDLWFPEDSLDVRYSATGDGRNIRSIREGSPGQKTAALLAFLLSHGDEPLILDQPEDDLDNLLIYDLIVAQLREVKRNRQVIVVTHNANIVVNGDAELVVALDVRGGETQKECEGSLQQIQVRETICSIMEGGHKAFKDRYRRIELEGDNV